ncbi:UDP-N-acetylmuramoyl-L-alanyl-D-glutamate--2,6-diaminopimelate ligase [Chiayiivirga flava]|nr:UDP-N-acetylmuramoyl-L-alanyl-D-glutamate--2,6-diaminopimelate ligase [Chiayiivirga flava]
MRLDMLLGDSHAPPIEIDALTLDSRAVTPGAAFVALGGGSTHGLRHAPQALAAGAACVLFEPPAPDDIVLPDAAIPVPGLRATLGAMADRFFGAPSHALTVIGVTGTNGKTSTVQLLAQAFSNAGAVAGSIGTLGAGLHGAIAAGERTTPDVIGVHGLLARMRDARASHVAMEVSSHALDQGRVDAVAFDVAVFTNLTRDHLDYHGTMAAYGAAKALLFDWPTLDAAVINIDDAFGPTLATRRGAAPRQITLSSRGAQATLRADAIVPNAAGLHFDLIHEGRSLPVRSRLLGRFNVDNLLAVAGTLLALDWAFADIVDALAALEPVPGRMSRLGGDAATPLVVIDYAHTPDALEQALATLRSHTAGRLFCVFGCGGERDRGKRPQMARIADAAADVVIVTDDNPRREPGDAIVAEIVAGFATAAVPLDANTSNPSAARIEGTLLPQRGGSCRQAEGGALARIFIQRDRAKAIIAAIAAALPGDTVLIAGKGHEPCQEVDGIKHPFDDLAHARAALETRA